MTLPPLVARAKAAAEALGFDKSCRDEDGMLLHVLAGRRGIERVAEIGTGTGVGTAWLASALPPGVTVVMAPSAPTSIRTLRVQPSGSMACSAKRATISSFRSFVCTCIEV